MKDHNSFDVIKAAKHLWFCLNLQVTCTVHGPHGPSWDTNGGSSWRLTIVTFSCFNVSVDDASELKKVKPGRQLTGDPSDVWESRSPLLGARMNLSYGPPQIHLQELKDHTGVTPTGKKGVASYEATCQDPGTGNASDGHVLDVLIQGCCANPSRSLYLYCVNIKAVVRQDYIT